MSKESVSQEDYQNVLLNPDKLRKYAIASGLTLAEAKAEIKEEAKALYTVETDY